MISNPSEGTERDQALPGPDIQQRLAFMEFRVVEDTISDRSQVVEINTVILGETAMATIEDPISPSVVLWLVHHGKATSPTRG